MSPKIGRGKTPLATVVTWLDKMNWKDREKAAIEKRE
jgi:hypothetical protein